jgi:hypothetical protein
MQEASLSPAEQIQGAEASLDEMSASGRARLAPLMPLVAALDADALFAFVVDRTIAGLIDFAEARSRPFRNRSS